MKDFLSKPPSELPANWKKWVLENALLGVPTKDIVFKLTEHGFSNQQIKNSLQDIKYSPYMAQAEEYKHDLEKRNWLLTTLHELSLLDNDVALLPKKKAPNFDDFVKHYYSKNLPGLFSGAIDHWPALKLWSPEYFKEKAGDAEIEYQNDRDKEPLFERVSQTLKAKTTMSEFVSLINTTNDSNNFYMTANNFKTNNENLSILFDDIANIGDDYLKRDAIEGRLWLGPAGTVTPAHHDLTNNLFVQIYGQKRVQLISSLAIPHVYNDMHVYSEVDFGKPNTKEYPLFKSVNMIEINMNPGDTLFIPIGWWHRVESVSISISMTFTEFRDLPNQFHTTFPRD